jgi:Icc-related predicted phosphoesterase
MNDSSKDLRIAVTSDIHYSRTSRGLCRDLFIRASQEADVLAICGDLTDYGLPEEAHVLVEDLQTHCRIPVVAILGNHDYESSRTHEVVTIMEQAGVRMLDGETAEIEGVGFVGVCGFGGGFGARMLNDWGEVAIKNFVHAAVEEALKLERALARLQTPQKIALLHYAPIRETVAGEDPEIFPFLGSTRLEGPLNRFNVTAAFHGHAHNGAHAGHTATGIPVFNVAVPLMKRDRPDHPPFMLFEVKRSATGS